MSQIMCSDIFLRYLFGMNYGMHLQFIVSKFYFINLKGLHFCISILPSKYTKIKIFLIISGFLSVFDFCVLNTRGLQCKMEIETTRL